MKIHENTKSFKRSVWECNSSEKMTKNEPEFKDEAEGNLKLKTGQWCIFPLYFLLQVWHPNWKYFGIVFRTC